MALTYEVINYMHTSTWRITARMRDTDQPNAELVVAEVYGG